MTVRAKINGGPENGRIVDIAERTRYIAFPAPDGGCCRYEDTGRDEFGFAAYAPEVGISAHRATMLPNVLVNGIERRVRLIDETVRFSRVAISESAMVLDIGPVAVVRTVAVRGPMPGESGVLECGPGSRLVRGDVIQFDDGTAFVEKVRRRKGRNVRATWKVAA